ncbi:hypothetical protein D3C86_1777050 [compost metagenome]
MERSPGVTELWAEHLTRSAGAAEVLTMPKKKPESQAVVTAAEIERSIQALNKMAERLWGDGRESEAKALLDALDSLNRALDRIRIGESRRVLH